MYGEQNIGGTNLTSIQYANIGNQIMFINTIKYYQQSLSSLVSSADEKGKEDIRKSMLDFLKKHRYFLEVFDFLTEEEKKWVLSYLFEGKGVTPDKIIKCYTNLEARPEPGMIFEKLEFYSLLKNETISDTVYKNAKKFYA